MKLYHGTSESAARRALQQGILPREASGKVGNWKHTVSSNPSMVYLTTAYAPYFALSTTDIDHERAAIIQVDLDLLDQTRLYPDEDFIEQALHGKKLGTSNDIRKRNLYVIKHIEEHRENWELSLEHLGNVCFKGTVPANAITKIVLVAPRKNLWMAMAALNPTITLENYESLGERYRALTRWYMGEDIDPVILAYGDLGLPLAELRKLPYAAERIEATATMLENRNGLEVLFESERLPSPA